MKGRAWIPDQWWNAFLRAWRKIGNTRALGASPEEQRWNGLVKLWKKIGNAYKNLTPPPPNLPGSHGFVKPDHTPLEPRARLIDHAPIDVVARSCGTKKRYATEDVANAVAIQCWHDRHVWLRAYACEICGGFHLTRSNAPPRMQAGWRPPKISERQQNLQRKRQRR
jgi:hypothetical protein